jgi:hypothetical protein
VEEFDLCDSPNVHQFFSTTND